VVTAVEHARSTRGGARTEQRLREVVDLLPDPLYVTDAEGTYLFANEALAEFHGRTTAELEGTTVDDVFPAEAAERFREDARDVI
jgi:PAS domain S-box-containing protein